MERLLLQRAERRSRDVLAGGELRQPGGAGVQLFVVEVAERAPVRGLNEFRVLGVTRWAAGDLQPAIEQVASGAGPRRSECAVDANAWNQSRRNSPPCPSSATADMTRPSPTTAGSSTIAESVQAGLRSRSIAGTSTPESVSEEVASAEHATHTTRTTNLCIGRHAVDVEAAGAGAEVQIHVQIEQAAGEERVATSPTSVVSPPGPPFVHISAGGKDLVQASTCAIGDDGTGTAALYCWGADQGGAFGSKQASPRKVMLTSPTAASVGTEHICAIANGRVHCWGRNGHGELGDGTTTDSIVPVPVSPP